MRTCTTCYKSKPDEEFSIGAGYYKTCQGCRTRAYTNHKARADKAVSNGANRFLFNKFGLTAEKHKALVDGQENKCGICTAELTHTQVVDHNHKTNKIRGVLCRACNAGLGFFRDDPEVLQRAIDYLAKNSLGR